MSAFFRSMGGRVFLVLVVGILASATLTWWLAVGERQRVIGQLRENRALEQIEQFILTLDAVLPSERQNFLMRARRYGIKGDMMEKFFPSAAVPSAPSVTSEFARMLAQRMGSDYLILSLPAAQEDCPPWPGRWVERSGPPPRGICEAFAVRLHDGAYARLMLLPPRPIPTPHIDWAYLALFFSSIAVLAYAVSRMTMRPLKRLAQAAEELGRNIDRQPLPQRGASEIRQAAQAFNAMQARIRDHIRQRTQMLAAITHDLQTPLTRLRLRLEKVPDAELRERLIEDLMQTQAIVREGLDLARSMEANEPAQALDLDSLLDSVCNDAIEAGQDVNLAGKTGLRLTGRPVALRRCLINLIDNAVKYGLRAHITAQREAENETAVACIRIRDNGSGIPADQLEKVFEPFYRLETSRSRETGGTGLGLTIARHIAQQHGGSLELISYPDGLEAVLRLPI